MKYILIIVAYFYVFYGYSQNIDSLNIVKAERIISNNFGNELDHSNYILYNLENKYLVILERPSQYCFYYVEEGEGIVGEEKIEKEHRLLQKAFNESSCSERFVYSQSDSLSQYRHPHTRYIYYYLNKKGDKKCEFNLPVLFNIDVSNIRVYPLDEKIQEYLSKKLFSKWRE